MQLAASPEKAASVHAASNYKYRDEDVPSGFSASRINCFFWAHRFHVLLLPLLVGCGALLESAVWQLVIVAEGGKVWPSGLVDFHYEMGPGVTEAEVFLAPIPVLLALIAVAGLALARVTRGAWAQLVAIAFVLAPAAAVSMTTAVATLNVDSGWPVTHPVLSALLAAVVLSGVGRGFYPLFRKLWCDALSASEFAAAWTLTNVLPWLVVAGMPLIKKLVPAAASWSSTLVDWLFHSR